MKELAELMACKPLYVRRTFASLIFISADGSSEDAVIELAHYTVREYFSSNDILGQGRHLQFLKDREGEAHYVVAQSCLEYLALCAQPEKAHEDDARECALRSRPLLEYAINYWYRHALECARRTDAAYSSLGSKLMAGLYQVYSVCQGLMTTLFTLKTTTPDGTIPSAWWSRKAPGTLEEPSGSSTHQAFLSWLQSAKSLLENCGMNPEQYRNAVKLAAYTGYEKMVDLILEHKAPASAGNRNYDALAAASSERYQLMMILLLEGDVGATYGERWWPENSDLGVCTDGVNIVRSLLLAGADVSAQSNRGETALHQAAAFGNVAVTRLLLTKGARIDPQCSGHGVVVQVQPWGFRWRWKCRGTPLHWAVTEGHEAVVRLLLENGDIHSRLDETGETALHLAARSTNAAMVRLLIENGARVNERDDTGYTALHVATYSDFEDVVELLLLNEADDQSRSIDGFVPLHTAALGGNPAVVELLLNRNVDVNSAGEDGFTALHLATQEKHVKVLEMLLARGADVSRKLTRHFGTALHTAAYFGHEDSIRILLDHGSMVDEETSSGQTPLSVAARSGHEAAAKLLLDAGAAVILRDMIWGTMLHNAVFGGNEMLVETLLKREEPSMDPKQVDSHGRTLLHFSSAGGKANMISKFLALGLAAGTQDKQGRTCLHFAASSKSLPAVKAVLAQDDVQPSLADKDGWTAMHWAARRGNKEVVEFLADKVELPKAMQDWSPLRIAQLHGHDHLIETLSALERKQPGQTDALGQHHQRKGYFHEEYGCDGCFLVSY